MDEKYILSAIYILLTTLFVSGALLIFVTFCFGSEIARRLKERRQRLAEKRIEEKAKLAVAMEKYREQYEKKEAERKKRDEERKKREAAEKAPRLIIKKVYPNPDNTFQSLIVEIFEPTGVDVTLNQWRMSAKLNERRGIYECYKEADSMFSPAITIKGKEIAKVEIKPYQYFDLDDRFPKKSGDWLDIWFTFAGVDKNGKFVSISSYKRFEIK